MVLTMTDIVASLPDDGPCMQIFSEDNDSVEAHGPPLANMPPKPSTDGKRRMVSRDHLLDDTAMD